MNAFAAAYRQIPVAKLLAAAARFKRAPSEYTETDVGALFETIGFEKPNETILGVITSVVRGSNSLEDALISTAAKLESDGVVHEQLFKVKELEPSAMQCPHCGRITFY